MVIIPAPLEAILLGGSGRAHRLSSKLPAFFQGCCSRGALAAEQAARAPHTSETQLLCAFLQTLGLTPQTLRQLQLRPLLTTWQCGFLLIAGESGRLTWLVRGLLLDGR